MTRASHGGTAGGPLHICFVLPVSVWGGVKTVILTLARTLLARGHRVDLLLPAYGQLGLQRPNDPATWDSAPAGVRIFHPNHDGSGRPPKTIWRTTRDGHMPTDAPVHIASASGARLPRDLLRLACSPGIDRSLLASYRSDHDRFRTQTQAIARYVETQRPDFLIANNPHPIVTSLLARCVVRRAPPTVPIIHNTREFQNTKQEKELARALFPTADRIVAVSHGVADAMRALQPRAADRIATIHNPIEPAVIAARAGAPPPHPWLNDGGPPVILGVGRLSGQKDFSTLLRAFARVVRAQPCRLLILGEGRERTRLEALARQLGIETGLALPGWVDNSHAAMARAAMVALSSIFEGLPMVLLEALACGCPVVSTDTPGASEILDGGRYGELVPIGDEEELARALLRVLEEEAGADPERARQKREERMQRADMFDAERVADRYLGLLAEATSGKGVVRDGAP